MVASVGGRFELWGKAEFENPSGSVKDRAAASIVRDALRRGELRAGRALLDASSGNTAVAYAALGARLGFPVRLYVPRNANPARLARLRELGADLVLTDPGEGTDGAQRLAREASAARPDLYFYADQYNNPANPLAHYLGTGRESGSRPRVESLYSWPASGLGGRSGYWPVPEGAEPRGPSGRGRALRADPRARGAEALAERGAPVDV